MNFWWNRPISDRKWNGFWALVFGIIYFAAIMATSFSESAEGHMVCISLIAVALTWYFTQSHFCTKSHKLILFRGRWWTWEQLNRLIVDNDAEMLRRACNADCEGS